MVDSREQKGEEEFSVLAEFCSRLTAVSDSEIIEVIKKRCVPERIERARGGNMDIMLGDVVAEAGRRRLTSVAPLIAEFCAWPAEDDFWFHVVPKALRALKAIGDTSIVPRLREIMALESVDSRSIESSVMTLCGETPVVRRPTDVAASNPGASQEVVVPPTRQTSIVVAAVQQGVWGVDQITLWADRLIEMEDDPPAWICELCVLNSTDVGPYKDLLREHSCPLSIREYLQVVIVAFQGQLLTLPEALTKLLWTFVDSRNEGEQHLDPEVQMLEGAVFEWSQQEDSPTKLRLEAEAFGMGTEVSDDREDAWLSPEHLDLAGEMLHRRLMSLFEALVVDGDDIIKTLVPERSIDCRSTELLLWLDESFVCNLFKHDLDLGWFYAHAKRALESSPDVFDGTIDVLIGGTETKSRMKSGNRQLLRFFWQSLDRPNDFGSLSFEQKWNLNCSVAEGITEAARFLTGNQGFQRIHQAVMQRKSMHPYWSELHGVSTNRLVDRDDAGHLG